MGMFQMGCVGIKNIVTQKFSTRGIPAENDCL